jgi:hypothetical protein
VSALDTPVQASQTLMEMMFPNVIM